MKTKGPNAAIELHDSELSHLERDGMTCTLVLNAYVHCSQGTPGVHPGSGWSQPATLRITRARFDGEAPALPLRLLGGRLTGPGVELHNLIPVPSLVSG